MEYGQVVTLLFVALLGYYAFLIVTDLQKAKAAQMAEQENHMEEDIDISDEAQSFQPKKVGREEEKKEEQPKDQKESAAADSPQNPVSTSDPVPAANRQEKTAEPEKPFHRPGYREAIMTDGILVEELFKQIEKLAETGYSDLGNVIYQCETAR